MGKGKTNKSAGVLLKPRKNEEKEKKRWGIVWSSFTIPKERKRKDHAREKEGIGLEFS